MKTYTKENYDQLLDIIENHYGFMRESLHPHVNEFLAGHDVPVFRVVFHSASGNIMIAFNVMTTSIDAIQIFDFIKSQYPKVDLADVYFQYKGGTLHGIDAYAAFETKLENDRLQNTSFDGNIEAGVILDPVILVVSDPIYPAWDERAWEQYEEFKKRKNIF